MLVWFIKFQVNYVWVWRDQRKVAKEIKVFPLKGVSNLNHLCDFRIRNVKEAKRKFFTLEKDTKLWDVIVGARMPRNSKRVVRIMESRQVLESFERRFPHVLQSTHM